MKSKNPILNKRVLVCYKNFKPTKIIKILLDIMFLFGKTKTIMVFFFNV